ncbi:hypothetical protein [Mucilaginibacter hurinus]|nr:hypothetical protein [Mucilaginibacter hurinus]
MSKDKGNKETKKAPAEGPKKAKSDYQSGKTSTSSLDAAFTTKKKK